MGAVASKLWKSPSEDAKPDIKPKKKVRSKTSRRRRHDPVVDMSLLNTGVTTRSKALTDSITTRSKSRQKSKGTSSVKERHHKRVGSPKQPIPALRPKASKRSASVEEGISREGQSKIVDVTEDNEVVDTSKSAGESEQEQPKSTSKRPRSNSDEDENRGIMTRSRKLLKYAEANTRKDKEVKRPTVVAAPAAVNEARVTRRAAKAIQDKSGATPSQSSDDDDGYAPVAQDNPRAEERAFKELKNELVVEYKDQQRRKAELRDKKRDACKREYDAARVQLVFEAMRERAEAKKQFNDKLEQQILAVTEILGNMRQGIDDERS